MIVMLLVSPKRRTRPLPGRRFASASTSTVLKKPVSGTTAVVVPDAPPPPSPPPSKPASDVVAGATARAASQATIHPLDTYKVRVQTNSGRQTKAVSKIGKLIPPPGGSFDPSRSLRMLGRNVVGLYRGVLGAASGAGIAIGAYFAFYSVTKNMLAKRTKMGPGGVAFVSGGVAAAGSSVVKVPLAVCIRSVQAGVYGNVFHAAKSICSAAGPQGLFTGYLPTVLEDVPDMAFKFAVYETLRSVHKTLVKGRSANVQEDFAMGAIAGAAAAAATTPLDVIKTTMMCSAANRPTMMSAARTVLKHDGVAGFFRGVGPRAASNGINSAVFFCFFEAIRSLMAKQAEQVC